MFDESRTPVAAATARRSIAKLQFGLLSQDKWMSVAQISAGGIIFELKFL